MSAAAEQAALPEPVLETAAVGAPLLSELGGATVGLVGMTPAARPLSQLLGAFGSRVVGYDPAVHTSDGLWTRWKVEPLGLRELMEQSDAVCVMLTYFSRYHGLLGERLQQRQLLVAERALGRPTDPERADAAALEHHRREGHRAHGARAHRVEREGVRLRVRQAHLRMVGWDGLDGHRSCTLVNLAKIAVQTGRPLRFDPKTQRFIDDEKAKVIRTQVETRKEALAASLLIPFGSLRAPVSFTGDLILFVYLFALSRFFTAAAAVTGAGVVSLMQP